MTPMDRVAKGMADLERAVAPLIASRPDIHVETTTRSDAPLFDLRVDGTIPKRHLEIRSLPLIEGVEPEVRYSWFWGAYRDDDPRVDGEGRGYGDLSDAIRVIQQWIIDGRPWRTIAWWPPSNP